MPANHDYIFCLQDSQNRFWKISETGSIYCSAQPYFLQFAPDGWNDIAVQNIRNKKYWGIDRSVTIPLTYVQDAAAILKHIFYTKGIEESVYLVIAFQQLEYIPTVSYGYWYKQIYRGEIDLSTFNHSGTKITCTTLEDGLPKYLKANENTTYELPMNVPEAINIKMDGIKLHNKAKYAVLDVEDAGGAAVGFENCAALSAIFTGQDGDGYGLAYKTQDFENINNDPAFAGAYCDSSANWIMKNAGSVAVTFPIIGKIDLHCILNPAGAFHANADFYFKKTGGTEYNIALAQNFVTGTDYSLPFSVTVTLQPNESLFLIRDFNLDSGSGGSGLLVNYLNTSLFDVQAITRMPTTYIKALTGQYIFNQLISKVTEGNYGGATSAYLTRYFQKVFTCGNALRGFDDAVMKINFADFFKDWDCFDAVGIIDRGITVDMDTKENLVDKLNIIVLNPPAKETFKVSVNKDYLFNELEIGYPEIKNEIGVLNGNQEFNCKYLWSIGTTKAPAKLDKVSKIQAACYSIEKIRVTTIAKDTTDNKSDNDVFTLYIEDTLQPAVDLIPAHYRLDRSLNSSVTDGLIEPETVFNLFLTPKRNLLRNGSFIRSNGYIIDGKVLSYKSSDKNKSLVCDGITEAADITISSLDDNFFTAIQMEGEFEAPDDLESILDTNPLQAYSFDIDGTTFYGIMQKTGIANASRKLQPMQFLSDSTNDLKKLIQYYG